MGKTGLPEAEAFLFAHMGGEGALVHIASADGAHEHFLTGGADCVAHLRSPDTLAPAGPVAIERLRQLGCAVLLRLVERSPAGRGSRRRARRRRLRPG